MDPYEDIVTELLPDGWEYVDDAVLECPCGYHIEYDGNCPEGHISPLRELGYI